MSRSAETDTVGSTNGRPSDPEKGPVRAKGRRTRERLLKAAVTVFERDGYLTARVADIVAEAGVAHGSFYTYFDSKERVFREAAAAVIDEINAALDSAVSSVQTPHDIVRAGHLMFLDMYREHAPMLALIEQVGATDDYFRDMRLDLRGRLTRRVDRAIQTMQERGFAQISGLDRIVLARALAGMVDNYSYAIFVLKEPFADGDLDTLYGIWLRALGVESPD